MRSWRSIGWRVALAVSLGGGVAGAAVAATQRVLPQGDEVARGVLVDGLASPGGERAASLASARVAELLERRVKLELDGQLVLERSVRELGGHIDEAALRDALLAVGRRGALLARLDEALEARRGHVAVDIPVRIPVEPLAEALDDFKQHRDRKAVAARWDFETEAATEHTEGLLVDVHQAAADIAELARRGGGSLALPVQHVPPRATRERVAAASFTHEVSSYQTRFGFVGSEAGRAQNIERAARGVHGLVMMPGEIISFNELVGPRSVDNGFAEAGEIYKGEMRMGIGGGTCQVASTLHAAAFLGGLTIVQRSNHSRPSGYIGVGLDATVAYPHVDLKLENPFAFPVAVRAVIDKGVLTLSLFGRDRPAEVSFAATTVGVRPYKRTVREASWLPEGRVIKKQKGIRGLTIEKTRSIRYTDGRRATETSTDVYPPTNEVYYVAPGTDEDEALPPMPDEAGGNEAGDGASDGETAERADEPSGQPGAAG